MESPIQLPPKSGEKPRSMVTPTPADEKESKINELLIDAARRISSSKDIKERTVNMGRYMVYLNRFLTAHNIDLKSQVKPVKEEKADKKGTFTERQVGVLNGIAKLVRNGVPEGDQPPGPKITYRRAINDQEMAVLLDNKILEETFELNTSEPLEEVADCLEAMEALAMFYKIEPITVEHSRQAQDVIIRREERDFASRSRQVTKKRRLI